MDDEQLRAELRGLIAEEVHQQLSQYRGAVSAELKFMDKELETGLKAIKGKFNSLGNEIRESHAERVRRGLPRRKASLGCGAGPFSPALSYSPGSEPLHGSVLPGPNSNFGGK